MKGSWQKKALGDVCSIDKIQDHFKNLPYVGMEHIESNSGRFTGSLEPFSVKSTTFKFSPQHLLYGRLRPYLNKVIKPDFQGHCSTEIFPIKPKSELSRDFLFYWFIKNETVEKINETSTGARMPRANMNKVMGFEFLLPPLPEQQRIVKTLDQAFEGLATAKANAEKNLLNARALFESYLNSVFTKRGEGWEEKRLDEVCQIKPPKSEAKNHLKDNDFVSFAPMEYLGINQKYLMSPLKKSLNTVVGSYTYFAEGDVLLAKITPCFENGKLGIAKDLVNGIGFGSSEFIVLRPNPALDKEFLYYFLLRQSFRDEGAQQMFGAVGQKRVSREFVEGNLIHLPSPPIQKDIVKRLDGLSNETQHLESIYKQKTEELDDLKKSLLHQAFQGEL